MKLSLNDIIGSTCIGGIRMTKRLCFIISLFVLCSCARIEQPNKPIYSDQLSCGSALENLAEMDGFNDYPTFSRGGKNNDQLTLNIKYQTADIKDPLKSYGGEVQEGFMFHYDYKENALYDATYQPLDTVEADLYKEHIKGLFDKYDAFLKDSGCSQDGISSNLKSLNSLYPSDEKILENYMDENDEFVNLLSCKGTECSIKQSEQFVELQDYTDLTIPTTSHLNKEGKMMKKIKLQETFTNNLVGFNVIMTYDEFNQLPVSYENSLSLASNPLYVQNFIRDIYFKYSDEVGPYLYIVYIDGHEANKGLETKETNLDYTQMDYTTWKQNSNNSMHQFWQDENGKIGYKMPNLTDTEITEWLWNRLKESPSNELDEKVYIDYMRIYDYTWQKMMGLREKYYQDFGI